MTITTLGRPILTDAMEPVIAALAAVGIRVAVDVKRINPPGAFLHPPTIAMRYRAGDFTCAYRLLLVVASKDRAQSYDDMSELLDQAIRALGDRPLVATPADVETSDQSTFLTAYELGWTDRVRQRNERPSP